MTRNHDKPDDYDKIAARIVGELYAMPEYKFIDMVPIANAVRYAVEATDTILADSIGRGGK